MTVLQRLSDSVAELSGELRLGGDQAVGTAEQCRQAEGFVAKVAALEPEVSKLSKRAAETDPDRKTYGPAMIAKIRALSQDFAGLQSASKERLEEALAADSSHKAEAAKNTSIEPPSATSKASASHGGLESSSSPAELFAPATPPALAGADSHTAGISASASALNGSEVTTPEVSQSNGPAGSGPAGAAHSRDGPSRAVEQPHKAVTAAPIPPAQKAAASSSGPAPDAKAKYKAPAKPSRNEVIAKDKLDQALKELTGLQSSWLSQARAAVPPVPPELPDGAPFTLRDGGPGLMRILQAAQVARRMVVVDFSTSWCGPCRVMKPVLNQLADEFRGKAAFVVLDCEESQANRLLASQAQIRAFPTFHIYQGTHRQHSFQGGKPFEAFRQIVQTQLSYNSPAPVCDPAAFGNLLAELKTLQEHTDEAAFIASCELLSKLVTNICQHPNDDKYQRLKASNARLKEGLLARPGGVKCLLACSFSVLMEAGEQVFVWRRTAGLTTLRDVVNLAAGTPAAIRDFTSEKARPDRLQGSRKIYRAASNLEAATECTSQVEGSSNSEGADVAAKPAGGGPRTSNADDEEVRQQAVTLLAAQLAEMLSKGQSAEGGPRL